MNRDLYIDCDGVIYDSVKEAFLEMKSLGIDTTNQDEITNYFRNCNWEKLLANTNILNDSINKINKLVDSWMFLNIHVLTHVSSFYEAIYKTELLEPQLDRVDVITLPINYQKEKIVNPVDNILVDDSRSKITAWIKAGGIGVLFRRDIEKLVMPFEISDNQDYFIISDLEDLLEIQHILNTPKSKTI